MAEACISTGEQDDNSPDGLCLNVGLITDMAEDKHKETAMWQQAQYLGDSGIHSGVTTQAPSLYGGSYLDEADEKSHVCSLEHGCCCSSNVDPAADEADKLRVDVGSEQLLESALVNLMDYQDDSDFALCAIPELVKLLQSGNHRVMSRAATIVQQLTKKETSRHSIMSSHPLVSSLVHAVEIMSDTETLRTLAGVMHNLSHHRQGLSALYTSSGISALVKLLSVPIENILFPTITSLHNLLLHQDGSKTAIRVAGGIQKMVALLKSKNVKFLAITADCLQILAYGDQESKLAILACGGPAELVRVMRTYSYEKLLWTTSRVLKVLSVCQHCKLAIVEAGGVTALAAHLQHPSGRLVQNCLWTLRNLSDVVTGTGGLDSVLPTLVYLLSSSDPHQALCAAGILSNLTCNNPRSKIIVCRSGGVEAFIRIIVQSSAHADIIEPAVCALRHLTSRHADAEMAQHMVRLHYGFDALVRLIQPSTRRSLLKSVIGLLQILALCAENQVPMREHGAVNQLIQLLFHAHHVRMRQQQQPWAPVAPGQHPHAGSSFIDEIIECIVSTLHILARETHSRAIIRGLNCVPVFVEMLHSRFENTQLVAAGVLCEIASEPVGAEAIEQTHAVAPLLKLMHSTNEVVTTYAACVLFRLSELVTRRSGRVNADQINVVASQHAGAACLQVAASEGQGNVEATELGSSYSEPFVHHVPTHPTNSETGAAHASGDITANSHPTSEDQVIDYAGSWHETDL